jgi:hypothetical protein
MSVNQKLPSFGSLSNSLLVSLPDGSLRRLRCPFSVFCLKQVLVLKKGKIAPVSAVHSGSNESLLYHIGRFWYPHSFFIIITHTN